MKTFSNDMLWVIFLLLEEQFAISTNHIREMVQLLDVGKLINEENIKIDETVSG